MSRRTRRTAEWPTEPPAAMGRGSSWTSRRTVPTAMSCRLRKLRLVAVPLSVVWDVCINSCVNPLLSYPACWRFGWVFNPTSRGNPADIRRTFRNASTSPSPHMYIVHTCDRPNIPIFVETLSLFPSPGKDGSSISDFKRIKISFTERRHLSHLVLLTWKPKRFRFFPENVSVFFPDFSGKKRNLKFPSLII